MFMWGYMLAAQSALSLLMRLGRYDCSHDSCAYTSVILLVSVQLDSLLTMLFKLPPTLSSKLHSSSFLAPLLEGLLLQFPFLSSAAAAFS